MSDLTTYPVLLKAKYGIHIAMARKTAFKRLQNNTPSPVIRLQPDCTKRCQQLARQFWPAADVQPQLQEPDVCPALSGRLMWLPQGRQGAQHAQRLSQPWSQSCVVSKSQRGKQICTNMPECDMDQLKYGHIFCCPLTSSVLDSCPHYLLGSNIPDKKCREKRSLEKKL